MKDNPNVIEVELTLSQLEYMEGWGRRMNGMAPDTLIRMMIDSMMRTQPQLADVPQKP
jgi:hypothetical protein